LFKKSDAIRVLNINVNAKVLLRGRGLLGWRNRMLCFE